MSQEIICNSTSISVLLKSYEDMETTDNSNSKLSIPMNAFLVVTGQKPMRNQNAKLNPNK